jgi:hypothetical protein
VTDPNLAAIARKAVLAALDELAQDGMGHAELLDDAEFDGLPQAEYENLCGQLGEEIKAVCDRVDALLTADTAPALPQAWRDLLEGLALLATHQTSDISPLNCTHDTLWVSSDPAEYSSEDIVRLDDLGFHPSDGGFMSYRFGSA